MNDHITETTTKAVAVFVIIVFGITALGTALLPAIIAYIYGWEWLLLYPAVLATLMIWARLSK